MKTATDQLKAFLASATQCAKADLYRIDLPGGTALRYTNADIAVADENGDVFLPLRIARSGTRLTRGVEVDSLDITIMADDTDLVNGTPLLPFIVNGGFRGAVVTLRRAFFENWGANLEGCVTLFAGRYSQMKQARGTEVQIAVKSWLELLNVQVPQNLFQPPCLHTLFDTGCTLNREAFAVAGSISAAGTPLAFSTGLTQAAGYFDQGRLVFLTGANAGITRSIKAHLGDGSLSLALALPSAPAAGDTFKAYPGCDHTQSTCAGKFANLINFRGFPYIPVAETAI